MAAALAIVGIALAAIGAATGQGRAASSAFDAMARQPEASSTIQLNLLLSLAFIETQTLFVLFMILQLRGLFGG